MAEAYYIAGSGRPGPVVVDFTKSAQNAPMHYEWPPEKILPGYNPVEKAHGRVLSEATELFQTSHRPVLYVGGGAVRADAGKQVAQLAHLTNAPVVTTLPARGIVPESDPQVLGMPGMHGTVPAVGAIQQSDLLVAIGTRFSDRVTGRLDAFAPTAKVIHIDIDPAEIGKNRKADVPIVGDVAKVLDDLIPKIEASHAEYGKPDLSAWWKQINGWIKDYPLTYDTPTDGSLAPQWVIQTLSQKADPATVWVSGVGQHQMWSSQYIDFENPHSWISSGGAGTMGFGLPAALGAQVGSERSFGGKKPVWLIDGDGSFQMTSQELATAFQESMPIKIAIINNSVYGMVRQWQTLFYKNHYSATSLHDGEANAHELSVDAKDTEPIADKKSFDVPDFVMLAQAYGCLGLRATTQEEALKAIDVANSVNDRPVLIDFRVWKDAMVFPMIPAGSSNDAIIYKPGVEPLNTGEPSEVGIAKGAEAAPAASAPAQDGSGSTVGTGSAAPDAVSGASSSDWNAQEEK
jgi:acetolactate synthase-1/2/3 large subunit